MLAMEALELRPYDSRDDDFIAALAKEAFSEYTPDAVLHTLSMVRRCKTLVAWQEVRVGARGGASRYVRVGFAALAEEGAGTLVLNAIAVVRGERGRGIGSRLMEEFERIGRARGVQRLELCTAD